MGKHDQTSMGGPRETFLTTHWSLIEDVNQHQDKDRALIGVLLQRYWKPVYCYVRRRGYDNEQAKDLTQGFLHEVVLNRHLIERADSAKGRFRTILLHALNQYILDSKRKDMARKRIPKDKLVSLDITDPAALPRFAQTLDAEQSFNYVWKAELLDRVLAEVKAAYIRQGMETHWQVFHDRLLGPSLDAQDPPSIKALCQRYDIKSAGAASNMVNTVKQRVRRVLKEHVRRTVLSGEMVQEELLEISKFLKKEDKI
jgi:hypothetical protein